MGSKRTNMSDFSTTTFGESGELTQVRHALTAVGNGETTIGIRAKNGIVIAAEKKLTSSLVDETSIHKVDKLCDYMGVTYSGIGPDFNAVLMKSRKDIQKYHAVYMDRITPFMMCKQVAELFQEYTQSGGVRPFGIGSKEARSFLEKTYSDDIDIGDAIHTAIKA